MASLIVPRRLTYQDATGVTHRVEQSALLDGTEPMVILGEAGMGKTTLLEELQAGGDARLIPARRLAASLDPRPLLGDARILIIDALDEAVGAQEGEAVDRVLARLEQLGNPQFILACRVADWRSATSIRAIADIYGQPPLELHLEPFDSEEARRVLAATFGEEPAAKIVAHFEERGLAELFGNPQTLKLIEAAASTKEELPDTRAGLFEAAIDVMWAEHSAAKQDKAIARLGKDMVLDAAGAAFATQILAGKEALSRAPRAQTGLDDLPIAEIAEAHVFDVLESRLFRSLGSERFTYAHRSIGEFLGARWLARRADTQRKRRRLLSLFDNQGLVPANLRGLHAWLVRDAALAADVIARDPMGVIEYGDADELTERQAEALLGALIELGQRNPGFRGWGPYRAAALIKAALQPRISALIADNKTGFGVRTLLLQVMSSSPEVEAFAPTLRNLMLDNRQYFAVRSRAGLALTKLGDAAGDWPAMLETLRQQASDDALRLAVELLPEVGFEQFDDRQIATIVAARAGLTLCALPKAHDGHSVAGIFYTLKRKLLDARLDGVLDELAELAHALLNRLDDYLDRADITDITFSLAARRVMLTAVEPMRLWHWLSPFEGLSGYHREPVEKLSAWFKVNPEARRTIQRYVLLERPGDKNLWQRQWCLERVVPGLGLDESDVVALLPVLGTPARPTDAEIERWKAFVQLIPHDAKRGAAAREAALAFAGKRKRLRSWLAKLALPRTPEWQIRQEKRQAKRLRERDKRWAGHRANFAKHADKLRAGEFGYVLLPAQAYLKLISDMRDDIPAHQRVEEWLGAELQDAVFAGFEAFLTHDPPKLNATEIAQSHAEERRWNAEYVIIAALAERMRTGRGFSDLPAERLIAGALILRQTQIDDHAKIEGLSEAIDDALKARNGEWEAYWRLQIEPQLVRRRTHVDGLYELMRRKDDAALAARLAIEWLGTYPDLFAEPESVMIDRLIASREYDALRDLEAARRTRGFEGDERRRNWEAVAFLVDFEGLRSWLDGIGARDPSLLWHLRRRLSDEHDEGKPRPWLHPQQLAWIVREFRGSWPLAHRPSGVATGDTNIWDATEFIRRTISRLGDDTTDDAIRELSALKEAPQDGYSEALAIVSAEQAQKRVEEQFVPPTAGYVAAVVTDAAPCSITDLRAVILEELEALKRRLDGSETDSWRRFWDGGAPIDENPARDLVIDLLGPNLPFGMQAATEVDMPSGKRADIGFSLGAMRLPAEAKRQWHSDLWHAADTQLERLYGIDHRASGVGVYLVIWFGDIAGKSVPRRPGGRPQPSSAAELERALIEESDAARNERVKIIVLDVSRRSA